MRHRTKICRAVIALGLCGLSAAARADSSESDYKTALAAAQSAEQQAAALKNRWTVTELALAAAKQAAAAGDFAAAVKEARRAEALAKVSIDQAKEEAEAWKMGVIR